MLAQVLAYSLIPVVASFAGGVIAAFWPPTPTVRSVIQHFTAGIVFSAAALELMPDIRAQSPIVAIVGFAVGITVLLIMRRIIAAVEGTTTNDPQGFERAVTTANTGLMVVTGVDILIDGLVLGTGFAAGAKIGVLLTIALTLEFLFLGLSVAATRAGVTRRLRLILETGGLGLLVVVGAMLGYVVLGHVSAAILAGVLAFGAVALMYLVTEDLLVEAHHVPDTGWAVALFCIGFLVFLVLDELM